MRGMANITETRLAATIEHWKRSLLDLTKRNRAIHFRLTRVSTLTLVDEDPAAVYHQLVHRRARLRFRAAPEPEPATGAAPVGAEKPAADAGGSVHAETRSGADAGGSEHAGIKSGADVGGSERTGDRPAASGEAPEGAAGAGSATRAADTLGANTVIGDATTPGRGTPAAGMLGAGAEGGHSAAAGTGTLGGETPGAGALGGDDAGGAPGGEALEASAVGGDSAAGDEAFIVDDPVPVAAGTRERNAPAEVAPADPDADILIDDPLPAPAAGGVPGTGWVTPGSGAQAAGKPYAATNSDSILQTTSTPEHLDRALRRLDEQARLALEEQGVNTLFLTLGMLRYADASGPLRAPLLLVPVALERKSARAGYSLQASDEDPLVNPALSEYLRRLHGLALPELPDENEQAEEAGRLVPSAAEGLDLRAWLAAVAEAVAGPGQAAWQVTGEMYLGLFSFQKFVMYKDLDANSAALQQHRLIRQLTARGAPVPLAPGDSGQAQADGGQLAAGELTDRRLPVTHYPLPTTSYQLPQDILALDLDQHYPPEHSDQVVDADGSQLRAIVASARGHDLVVEGPPGTGKSQTITNLIAQALGNGKSVLFVAEKMAALEVVYRRLVAAGLGEFCLELHSTKANKRAVIQAVKTALDASLQRPASLGVSPHGNAGAGAYGSGEDPAGPRLGPVRATLSTYARAVHEPFGALEVSPYRGYGELGAVLEAPRLRLSQPVEALTRAQLDEALRALDDLAAAAEPIGRPDNHPWRDTTRSFYTEDDLEQVRALAGQVQASLAQLSQRIGPARALLGLPPMRALADVDTALRIGDMLARSPGVPLAVLQSPAGSAPPPAAAELIALGR
jgi:hypothetical protein